METKMDFIDKATKFLGDCIGILITQHPLRTSIGAVLGVVLLFIDHVFGNLLDDPTKNPFHGIDQWLFIFVGVFITHIPTFISLMSIQPEFDENIEYAFKAIDKAKTEGMPVCQVNQAYKNLCELILENSSPKSGKESSGSLKD
jgi:hypothetical protein